MTTQLKSKCPHCSAEMRVHESLVGQRVRCPACNEPFEVDSVEIASEASLERAPLATETMAPGKGSTANISGGGDRAKSSAKQESSVGKLGRFELKEVLGQGAFGRVYRAYDPQLDRFVALKVPTFGPRDTHKIQRFLAEAKAAARLRHPNIVPTYESGQIDGQYYIAAQFVAGETLSSRLQHAPPDFRRAAEWVRQLAEALAYAHREGIVHRDIKPDNIMLDGHDQPQIMDFGLAKRVNDDAAMTTDGSILGTPAYMSPEQARGKLSEVGPHSDQYSLGVVLYELLTGQKPFDGQSHAVIARVIGEEPQSLRSLRPDIPRDLAAICQKAMRKEAARRFTSTAELAEDLARWLRGDATLARPISIAERSLRWCRRNPAIASLTSAVAALLILGIALATTMAWIRAKNADELRAILADLEQQRDRATEAEESAKRQAKDAVEQKERADKHAADASAEAARHKTTLDQLTAATIAATDSSQQVEKYRGERAADHRQSFSRAQRAFAEGRPLEALQHLADCPADLRDQAWTDFSSLVHSRDFTVVPAGKSWGSKAQFFFTPDRKLAVLDGEAALQLINLVNGELKLDLLRAEKQRGAAHHTFFSGTSVIMLFAKQVVGCDWESLKPITPYTFATGEQPRFSSSYTERASEQPMQFNPLDNIIIDIHPMAGLPTVTLLERSRSNGWCVGLARPPPKFQNPTVLEVNPARYAYGSPVHPLAVDVYGKYGVYADAGGNCLVDTIPDNFSHHAWSVQTGRNARLPVLPGASGKNVKSATLVENILALAYSDKVAVWDIAAKPKIDPVVGKAVAGVVSAVIGPDQGVKLHEWPIAANSTLITAVSPEGKLVATYDYERAAIAIRSVATGQLIRVFDQHSQVQNLDFDRGLPGDSFSKPKPKGIRLGWISDQGVCIWEPQSDADLEPQVFVAKQTGTSQ